MSYSANHKNKKNYLKYLEKEYLEDKIQKPISYKRESSKKDKSRLSIANLNFKYTPHNFSNSSTNTNISLKKERKDNYTYFSYPIKTIMEDNIENSFMQKRKLGHKSYKVLNNKVISFQNQKNKQILEFSLFDDNFIFKDLNKSYLQDEHSDDGADSSEEKINDGRIYLSQEIDDTIKQLSKSIKKNQEQKILSRRMRFKNDEK